MRTIAAPASASEVSSSLTSEGWALLPTTLLYPWLSADASQAEALHASWNDLPPDTHLRDGGHYRFRRHSCFVYDTAARTLTQTPHRAMATRSPTTRCTASSAGSSPCTTTSRSTRCERGPAAPARRLPGRGQARAAWYIEAHQFRGRHHRRH